jgi:hypothetical protein
MAWKGFKFSLQNPEMTLCHRWDTFLYAQLTHVRDNNMYTTFFMHVLS